MPAIKQESLVRPTSLRIIVQEDAFDYRGKIIIPDKVQRRPTTGVIIAVGDKVGRTVTRSRILPGKEGQEDDVVYEDVFEPIFEIGDRVVYGLYSGTVINFKNQPAMRCLTEDEILGWVMTNEELEGVGT